MTTEAHSDSLESAPSPAADITKNGKPDLLSSALKVLLFSLPPTLVEEFHLHSHGTMYGLSLVAGALLQTLIPPHTYRIWAILGVAFAGAIISLLIFH